MIDFSTYKWLHLVGVFLILLSLGSLIQRAATGFDVTSISKRWLSAAHGVGMLAAAVGGFGMLARMGITGQDWPWWVSFKFGIWLAVGFIIVPVNRAGHRPLTWWLLVLILTMSAAFIGLNHSVLG